MKAKVVDEGLKSVKYPIRPKDINVKRHFYSAFGWAEAEVAANYLVRFFQKLGGWKAFELKDLDQFYAKNGGKKEWFTSKDKFPLYWLNGKLLLRQRRDGHYCVTDEFINRCYNASPKK